MNVPVETVDTLIIGGGLSGIYAAHLCCPGESIPLSSSKPVIVLGKGFYALNTTGFSLI